MDPASRASIVGICGIGGRVDLDLSVYSVFRNPATTFCAEGNQWLGADYTAAPMASPCLTSAGQQTRSPLPGLDINDLQVSPGTRPALDYASNRREANWPWSIGFSIPRRLGSCRPRDPPSAWGATSLRALNPRRPASVVKVSASSNREGRNRCTASGGKQRAPHPGLDRTGPGRGFGGRAEDPDPGEGRRSMDGLGIQSWSALAAGGLALWAIISTGRCSGHLIGPRRDGAREPGLRWGIRWVRWGLRNLRWDGSLSAPSRSASTCSQLEPGRKRPRDVHRARPHPGLAWDYPSNKRASRIHF